MDSTTSTRWLRGLAVALAAAVALSLAPLAPAKACPPGGDDSLRSAVPTVKRWLRHLEEGESRQAWRLMTKQSRRAIGGFETFKDESSAWAEGWGAWAEARDRDFELQVIAPMDDEAASVVTMTGQVAREGPYTPSAAALPVITHDGTTKVDPVHGEALVEPVRPVWGEELGERPRFEAIIKHIRARTNFASFAVVGSELEPQTAALEKIGDRSYRATLRWPERLGDGPHVVTITSWGRDGFKAVAMLFKVKG